MNLFLDTIKQDYIDGKMKIEETSYKRKSRLNGKIIKVSTYRMVWQDGSISQVSKNRLKVFLAEVKDDIS